MADVDLPLPEDINLGGRMPSRSEHGWLSGVFRKRKTTKAVSSVSAFVHTMDKTEADARIEPPRLVAAQPHPQASNDSLGYLRPSIRTGRAHQLEAENIRLRQMVGDLMLEAEILRAAMRRSLTEVSSNSAAAR